MADFTNKKIRKFFEDEVCSASAEDIALLITLSKPQLKRALARIAEIADATDVALDPEPVKPPKVRNDGQADG